MKEIGIFKTDQSGFTLVEILVSLVIILILVMAFVPMFELIAKTVSSNKAKDTATALANQQIEYLRTLPYIVVDDAGNIDESKQQLGTINGNPPGSVDPEKPESVQGKEYTIKTNITWSDASLLSKDISVRVEYIGAFGDKLVVSKFFTKAAEEKQLVANKQGSILVKVLDKDGLPLTKTDVCVKIDPQTGDGSPQQGYTQEGEKLFAMLPPGTYVVSAEVPDNMTYSPDQSIVSGWLEQDADVVDNAPPVPKSFYIDYPGRITLAFKANNKNSVGNGNLELSWTNDENAPVPLLQKQFDADAFNDNRLPASFLGSLWPGGNYSLKVSDLLDTDSLHIYNYDMTVDSKPLLNGADWNGTFETSDTTLDLTIMFTTANSLMHAYLTIGSDPDNFNDTLQYHVEDEVTYIDSWIDQSGKENDANPGNDEETKPTLESGPPMSISFTGGNNHQRLTFSKTCPYDNFTVFFVAKTNQSIGFVTNGDTLSKEQLNLLMYSGATNELGISLGKNGVSTCEYSNGNKYKQTVNYDANIGDGFNVIAVNCKNRTPNIYVNNTRTVGVLSLADPLYLASIIGGGPHVSNSYFSGNIAEVIIYNSSLSDSNMDYIITHLMEKFDLE